MNKTQSIARTWPHLVIEREAGSMDEFGYLHLSRMSEKILIGESMSREFRLLLCLFSPQNFLTAKYNPVAQTHERIFSFIGAKKGSPNSLMSTQTYKEGEIFALIKSTVRNIQKSDVGKFVSLVLQGDRLRMEIPLQSVATS